VAPRAASSARFNAGSAWGRPPGWVPAAADNDSPLDLQRATREGQVRPCPRRLSVNARRHEAWASGLRIRMCAIWSFQNVGRSCGNGKPRVVVAARSTDHGSKSFARAKVASVRPKDTGFETERGAS